MKVVERRGCSEKNDEKSDKKRRKNDKRSELV